MYKSIIGLFIAFVSLGCGVGAQTVSRPSTPYRSAADYSRDSRGLSIVILQGDKVVFEEYHNGHTADAAWMLASGTKSFSGVMLAAAIEDGIVKSFDETVSDTITEWKSDQQRKAITLRDLLSLTSGIDGGAIGRPPAYSTAVKARMNYRPGEKFEYGPVPFQVFGEVMRRKLAARNESVMNYLERRILGPMGLKAARWTMQEGEPNLPSGAFLTAREWLKFGRFLKDGGKWNGKQIIKKELLDELVVGTKANPNYGITFWLNRTYDGEASVAADGGRARELLGGRQAGTTVISEQGIGRAIPADTYMAAGAGNQRLYIVPSLDLVVVRQGRQAKFDDREFLSRLLGK